MNRILSALKKLPYTYILVLLLSTDMLFISMHILRSLPGIDLIAILEEDPFSIATDWGLGETFQYIKEFWIGLLLAGLALKYSQKSLAGWSLFFGYLLIDDMLKFHESIGDWGGKFFEIPASLASGTRVRTEDFVELAFLGIVGMFFLIVLIIAYLKSTTESRRIQRNLFILFAVLVAFGVGWDFLDRFTDSRVLSEILKLLEDGGEMLTMSVICWYTMVTYQKQSESLSDRTSPAG